MVCEGQPFGAESLVTLYRHTLWPMPCFRIQIIKMICIGYDLLGVNPSSPRVLAATEGIYPLSTVRSDCVLHAVSLLLLM